MLKAFVARQSQKLTTVVYNLAIICRVFMKMVISGLKTMLFTLRIFTSCVSVQCVIVWGGRGNVKLRRYEEDR